MLNCCPGSFVYFYDYAHREAMKLEMPHKKNPCCCMVSGLDDMYTKATGSALPQYFLFWASGMANFAYLRFKCAKPPIMLFFSTSPKYQYRNLSETLKVKVTEIEGHAFSSSLAKMRAFLDEGRSVVLGPMDMYYLPYLKFYKKSHIPIHYVHLIGYNDEEKAAYVLDCDRSNVEEVSYEDLKAALDVDVPGLGKRNGMHVFEFMHPTPKLEELAKNSLIQKVRLMLSPPARNFGIAGMRKAAKDSLMWDVQFGKEAVSDSLNQMLYYMDDKFEGRSYDGGRLRYASEYLPVCARAIDERIMEYAPAFIESGKLLDEMSRKVMKGDRSSFATVMDKVADIEENAYNGLGELLK